VRVLRPMNVLMMGAGVAVGGVLATGGSALAGVAGGAVLLAMASAASIGAAANAINDVFDLDIDRINRPDRPLPSGEVSVRAARTAWAGFSALGVGLAALLSVPHLLVAVASVALLYGYSARLKRRPLVGNLAVAAVLGLAIPYGGGAALLGASGRLGPALLGGAFAFAVTLARELAKDIEDMAGDAADGAQTLPLRAGVGPAAWLAAATSLAAVVALPVGPAAGLPPSFVAISLPVAMLLLAAAWIVLGAREVEPAEAAVRGGRASLVFKAAMFAGLVALAVAAW
jgi:geranylgeranylglycerol-phosphate geranylgeranyltransferase